MGLLTYREYRKNKKTLSIDMRVETLQESVHYLMRNGNFLEAMRQIKEIWKLKTQPWIYSSSMVTYIECLVRNRRYRDVGQLEKQLLEFYQTVMDISPRLLLSFAHEVMETSSSRRAFHAALLSFYGAVLAQNSLKKKDAMLLTVQSTNFIKDAIDEMRDETIVKEYLLTLMKELQRHLQAVNTEDDKKLRIKDCCVDQTSNTISSVRKQIDWEKSKRKRTDTRSKYRPQYHKKEELSTSSSSRRVVRSASSGRERETRYSRKSTSLGSKSPKASRSTENSKTVTGESDNSISAKREPEKTHESSHDLNQELSNSPTGVSTLKGNSSNDEVPTPYTNIFPGERSNSNRSRSSSSGYRTNISPSHSTTRNTAVKVEQFV